MLKPRETGQGAMNDDAVEAMIDKRPQLAEQLDEYIHGLQHATRHCGEEGRPGPS